VPGHSKSLSGPRLARGPRVGNPWFNGWRWKLEGGGGRDGSVCWGGMKLGSTDF
jgi:hypothetical protein